MCKKSKNKDLILVGIPVLLILMLYWQVAYFVNYTNWDTPIFIINNKFLQNFSLYNVRSILTPGAIHNEVLFIPVTYFSYMAEINIFGLSSSIMHIDNVLLHLSNTILLYYFALLLIRKRIVAFVASLIFAVHPLQVEAVCWIMARKDLLMTFFSLLSCIFWIKKECIEKKNIYFILSLICLILACLSKPTALMLPLILLLISICFILKANWFSTFIISSMNINNSNSQSYICGTNPLVYKKKESFFVEIISLIPFFVSSLIIHFINLLIYNNLPSGMSSIRYLPSLIIGWCSRILLLSKSEIAYTMKWADSAIQFNTTFLLSVVIISFIIIYTLRRKVKHTAFCILFTFISFLPAFSAFLSKRPIVTADRYGYFPLIGIFIFVGIIISEECRIWEKVCKYCLVFIWIAGMIVSTYTLISVWQSTKTLWNYEIEIKPNSQYGLHNIANYHFDQGNLDLALQFLLKSSKIADNKITYYNIAEIYKGRDEINKAIFYYKKAIEIDPGNSDYHGLLGTMYLKDNMLVDALREFTIVTQLKPDQPKAYLFIRDIFIANKNYKKAEEVHRIYEQKKSLQNETNNLNP